MPDLMSAALFERGDVALVAHRRGDRPPFAGQWLLPMTVVRDDEAAEDALRRHAREQFALTLGVEQFVDTVYMEDPDDQHRYVTNIFRAPIEGGPLRFDAEGDYDDARWLAAKDLAALRMPPSLRDPLIRIMTDPDAPATHDWASGEAVPLGEPQAAVADEAAPDNAAGWDTVASAWQAERFGDRFGDRLMWSWRASEDDLHVLDEIHGKRAIVLGCGGGQDVVALEKMGAIAVGVDQSPKQLEYARKYAARHSATNASFVEGAIEDLTRFDDESFDLAVSIHVLEYVADVDVVLSGAARVLKPGGVLAIAVKHPFDVHVDGGPPYAVVTPYWEPHRDTTFELGGAAPVRFRSYFPTMGQWLDSLNRVGFVLERLFEPKEDEFEPIADELDERWLSLLPYTLVMKARKR